MIRIIISLIIIIYVWFIHYLLLTKKKKYDETFDEPESVIIPCYNEEKEWLIKNVEALISANAKEIIIVDNNSNNEKGTIDAYKYLKKYYPEVKIIRETTQGKRHAHVRGVKEAKNNIIIFVDSDTIIDKKAIKEIKKPFKDEKVGCVAGKVLVYNKSQNILTRAIDSMFWTSCSIYRQATGNAGFMQVAAGSLSAYRKKVLEQLTDEYLNQEFLGRKANISDDRFLTMRTQTRLGLKAVYQDTAVAYTVVPSTIKGFWKTLERWKRGVLREVILLWKQPKKNNKLLFFDTQINFLMMNTMIIFKILLIIDLIKHFNTINLFSTFAWFSLMTLLYSNYLLLTNIKDYFFKIIYTFLYEFLFSFTYVQALINIRNQGKWVTR